MQWWMQPMLLKYSAGTLRSRSLPAWHELLRSLIALRKFWRCHSKLHLRNSPVVFCAHALSVVLISRLDDLLARAMSASFALYNASAPRTSSGVMPVGARREERLFGQPSTLPGAANPTPPSAAKGAAPPSASASPFGCLPSLASVVSAANDFSR